MKTQQQIKRYNDLFKMLKAGKAIVDGKVSQKLSDLNKVRNEFRLSAPSCAKSNTCNECPNKNMCWE